MRNAVNLAYLIVYFCVFLIEDTLAPTFNRPAYVYAWAVGPLLYPFCLALGHVPTEFWKGFWRSLLTIIFITAVAYVLGAAVYLLRTEGFQVPESITIVQLGFHLIGPLVSAVVWYPIGYLASWLLLHRKAG